MLENWAIFENRSGGIAAHHERVTIGLVSYGPVVCCAVTAQRLR
jgi:hypothetical protein